jgi:hypothetical protein
MMMPGNCVAMKQYVASVGGKIHFDPTSNDAWDKLVSEPVSEFEIYFACSGPCVKIAL